MNEVFLLLVLGSIPSSILWVFFWYSISFFFSIFSIFFFINFWPSTYEYTQNVLVLKKQIFILQIHVSYMPVCLVVSCCLQPHDDSPSGFSVHGILQARILEWVAIFSSTGIFLMQGSNSHLLHWQVDSLPLSHLEWLRYMLVLSSSFIVQYF